MKRLLAIILLVLMLTACGAKKQQEEKPAEEPGVQVEVIEQETTEEPIAALPEEEPEEEPEEVRIVEYESLMVDGVVEDTVGFGFEIPVFDCPGSEKIRTYFDDFVLDMENFTKGVVYEKAMARSCIVSVYGKVEQAAEADGVLSVNYAYECRYSDSEQPEIERTVLRFDMATGDLVK